jgi:hypothetical protein
MPKRNCAACGENKDVEGGKICETGHFVCKKCFWATSGVFSSPSKQCPVCKKHLS